MSTPGNDSFLPTASLDVVLDNPNPVPFPGAYDALLERLQGNILKGHGRDFTVNIFLRFNDGETAERIRAELQRLASEYVTSAARQLMEAEQRREWGLPGMLFGNLFLGRKAYDRLGFEAKKLSTAFADPRDGNARPITTNFLDGHEVCGSGSQGLHRQSGRTAGEGLCGRTSPRAAAPC